MLLHTYMNMIKKKIKKLKVNQGWILVDGSY